MIFRGTPQMSESRKNVSPVGLKEIAVRVTGDMRLTDVQRAHIKQSILQFLPDASVFLYGSRTDDSKRGGDIDLLVLSGQAVTRELETKIFRELYSRLGERKIDLLIRPALDPGNFASYLLHQAQPL